jgi:hypothetical protein
MKTDTRGFVATRRGLHKLRAVLSLPAGGRRAHRLSAASVCSRPCGLKVFGFRSNLASRSVIIRPGCQGRMSVFHYKGHDLDEVCPGQQSGASSLMSPRQN